MAKFFRNADDYIKIHGQKQGAPKTLCFPLWRAKELMERHASSVMVPGLCTPELTCEGILVIAGGPFFIKLWYKAFAHHI